MELSGAPNAPTKPPGYALAFGRGVFHQTSRSALSLEPMAMSGLLGAIAAHRHAAPPSPPSPCVVGEDQSAEVSLAGPDVGEILIAHASRQRLGDRRQRDSGDRQRRVVCSSKRSPSATQSYAAEHFITLKKRVQGPEFTHRLWRERPAHVHADKASEPFAQGARLTSDLIEFAGRVCAVSAFERGGRDQLRLSEPRNKALAILEPVDRCFDRRRNGVQEVEARRVGNEVCRRSRSGVVAVRISQS